MKETKEKIDINVEVGMQIFKSKGRKVALVVLGMCMILGVIIWSYTGEEYTSIVYDAEYEVWQEGWTQLVDGEEIELENISEFQEIPVGETLVFVSEIPEMTAEKVLYFYSKDLEVKVYIDDILCYEFLMQDQFEFLKTPGNTWNMVEIPKESAGESIRLEFTSQFANRYMETVTELYWIGACDANDVLIKEDSFRILMSLFVLCISISAYVDAFLWKRNSIKRFFLALGTFSFSVTVWLLSMSGLLVIMGNPPITSYLISMIMVSVIPIAVYEFFRIIYPEESNILRVLGVLAWGDFFLQFILQFVFGISLLDMLPLTYVVFAAGSLIIIFVIVQYIVRHVQQHKPYSELNFGVVTSLIFFIGAVVEIIVLCALPKRTDLIGVASVTGVGIYLLLNHFELTRHESRIDIEKMELEENYNKLQNTTLIQQIKAHYFFNTLNTISSLCKYDARGADHAIKTLASYMHSYMHLINEQENIPFEKELELVKSSLEIEAMRFPDTFTYHIEIEYGEFLLPPLSIQPIVENAMIHGFRKMDAEGVLVIRTQKVGNRVQVIVADNGMGFEPSILEKSESIGLKNLEKRIEIMANGSLSIKSSINKGTEVIIELPM